MPVDGISGSQKRRALAVKSKAVSIVTFITLVAPADAVKVNSVLISDSAFRTRLTSATMLNANAIDADISLIACALAVNVNAAAIDADASLSRCAVDAIAKDVGIVAAAFITAFAFDVKVNAVGIVATIFVAS